MRQGGQHRALVEVTNARPIPHRKPHNHVFSGLRPMGRRLGNTFGKFGKSPPTASTPRAYTLPNTPQTSINP
ncbi:MAG: hypothetical protein ACFNVO_09955 [Prevotella sp.]